jgi:hypothetical protein
MGQSLSLRVLGCILLLDVLISAQPLPVEPSDHVFVALLDDAREEIVDPVAGEVRHRIIRPAFERTPSGWQQANGLTLPARMKWTIAFGGENVGQVESQATAGWDFTAYQRILTPASAVPTVGSPSEYFAGILYNPGTKFHRPLVAVSKPYYQDPDGWKRAKLPDAVGASVRKAFRREYPHVDRCKDEQIAEKDWKFPDSALALDVAYASKNRAFLVVAALEAGNCGFINDPDDPNSDPWFFVSPDGAVRRIGSFMSLLDAGDYDNDGQSEVVFFLSQPENTDGFVLYDASFLKPVILSWHYH